MLLFTYEIYRKIFPIVHHELNRWQEKANQIPDPELKKQALDSINNKTFHCEGGSIYAVPAAKYREILIPLIVAYQTISDYLDNLCDRSTSLDSRDFRQLHQSMLDAVTPGAPLKNYYKYRNEQQDGNYLNELVGTCQRLTGRLPGYDKVQKDIFRLAVLYTDLQVYKHIDPDKREKQLWSWWQSHSEKYSGILWNEFAAATGSTLGIFMLFQAAVNKNLKKDETEQIIKSYFPWICGLHILLDYLVDLEEDRIGGDLNFITYYENQKQIKDRLSMFIERSRQQAIKLPNAKFHLRVIDGLVGLYLADGKVDRQPEVADISRHLMKKTSWKARFFFWNSRLYRGKNQQNQSPR